MSTPNLDEVDVQHRRTLLIAGVVSLAVVLIGVGVALAVLATRRPSSKPPITSAEETSATPSASGVTSSVATTSSPTSTPSPTSTVTSSRATSTTPSGQIVRSGRIAYRLGGQIWVSAEDGSGAKAVFASATGDYALSPDGKTLVAQQGASSYVLVDTTSGTQISLAGPVELPSWSPDSSWLAYTAGSATSGYSIRHVNRDGTMDSLVATAGAEPQIAPDGHRVAFTTSLDPSSTAPLQVYDTSTKVLRAIPNGKGAQQFAWAPGGALFFVKDSIGSVPGWLGMTGTTLSKTSVIASLTVNNPPVSSGPLFPSPDGSKVLFALTGDDGYSRLEIADVAAKKITAPMTRYDIYPMGWLLDGSAVLYIDGNAIQGEATSLYRMRPDGTQRTLVVKGAGL